MSRKKIFALALMGALILTQPHAAAADVSARSAILIEATTGETLFELNSREKLPIASTTKIMTALVVLESCGMQEQVEIKGEYTSVEGSSMYLREGEILTVEELLYGMMLSSGNDAATALAYFTAGDIQSFADMMNDKARELGLCDTHFENPHGLSSAEHYSTAADMAALTAYAMENPDFAAVVGTKSRTIGERTLQNHNKLLWMYDGAVGVKTGYTMDAGRCLVSCAKRDGMTLICVTLNDKNDWADHAALFDYGFENYRFFTVGDDTYEIQTVSGEKESLTALPEKKLSLLVKADDEVKIKTELPKFLYAPVLKGEPLGRITVTVNGETRAEIPVISAESVALDKSVPLNFREKLLRGWRMANKYGYNNYTVNLR